MLHAIKFGCGFAIGTAMAPFAFVAGVLLLVGVVFVGFVVADWIHKLTRKVKNHGRR